MNIVFWPHTQDTNIASYRMRCAAVVEGLKKRNHNVEVVSTPKASNVLVLSKRYDVKSLELAVALRKKNGTKLLLDLCDNHFYHRGDHEFAIQRAAMLRETLETVDCVVASSDYLSEQLTVMANLKGPVFVLDDVIEHPFFPPFPKKLTNCAAEFEFLKLKFKLSGVSSSKVFRLVWFGNSGGGFVNGGMEDLSILRSQLEHLRLSYPISLTVVSNSKELFRSVCSDWGLPVFYCPWDKTTISRVLQLHGVSLIPVQKTPFTLAKTANRLVTSLTHGLLVLADHIPSYTQYSESVLLDDVGENLGRVLSDPNVWTERASRYSQSVDIASHNDRVITSWGNLLVSLSA